MEQVLAKEARRQVRLRQPPRVLYVVAMDPSHKFGSLEEQMALLASHFRANGSQFIPLFICPTLPQAPTPIEQEGVEIACLDLCEFRWKSLQQLIGLIKRYKIEIVHWNFVDPVRNKYLWWLSVLQPRVAHYYTDHFSRAASLPAPPAGVRHALKRALLRRYTKVVCVSQFVFDCLEEENAWSNLVCLRHFINNARFRPDPQVRKAIRQQCEVDDCFVVLIVAHLIKDKGVDVLLRAMASLPENLVLWVVGTGVEGEELRRLAEDLGIRDRVTFHGSQQHVEPFMQGADCFVCPSIWAEAAGLVNLEAQASGLPVVASDIGGIPEYVADGITGFLFPAGDADELAAHLRRLSSDRALRDRLSESARELVAEKFSPAALLDDFVAIYCP